MQALVFYALQLACAVQAVVVLTLRFEAIVVKSVGALCCLLHFVAGKFFVRAKTEVFAHLRPALRMTFHRAEAALVAPML